MFTTYDALRLWKSFHTDHGAVVLCVCCTVSSCGAYVQGIQMSTKKKLCSIKGLSEAKVDKIKEVTVKLSGVGRSTMFCSLFMIRTVMDMLVVLESPLY